MLRTLARRLPVELRSGLRMAWSSLAKARLWEWGLSRLDSPSLAPFSVVYLGRLGELAIATDLFGGSSVDATAEGALSAAASAHGAIVSELPLPGSLRVPGQLRTLVSLGVPLAQILAGYEPELRRRIRRLSAGASVRQVTDEREIREVYRELLVPFALSRHGERAVLGGEADTVRIAKSGYLGLVSSGSEVVAAHLGFSYRRAGQDVWAAVRFGYPARVFDDRKRLADANTLNAWCALEHAVASGADVFDFGTSCARPEGGLLEFKRRRGGALSTFACEPWFSVRLPRTGSAEFLWRWPLFALERGQLALHLGVPAAVGDGEILARMKTMAYGGLEVICLHAERPIAPSLLRSAREIYSSSAGAVHGKGSARRLEVLEAARTPIQTT